MASSGEIFILNKISDLAIRCGVSPVVADIGLHYHTSENSHECYYSLGGSGVAAFTAKDDKKVARVWSLLGLDESGFRRIGTLDEAEQVVDHALSQVPRPRLR